MSRILLLRVIRAFGPFHRRREFLRSATILFLASCIAGSFGLVAAQNNVLARNNRASASPKRAAGIELTPLAKKQAAQSLARLPWAFEPNAGQIDARVKFLARADDATVFITQTGAVIAWRAGSAKAPHTSHRSEGDLRLQFVNANQSAAISGDDELPGKTNYLIGNNPREWHTGVPHFAAVNYKDIYPGIGARFYGGEAGLEYDLSVSSHTDLALVVLRADGSGALHLDSRGNLIARVGGREIRMRRPRIYQLNGDRKIPVAGGYRILGKDSFGFRVGSHRGDLPLVIDPSISVAYTTFLGGNGAEKGSSVAVDSTGAVYVGGTTTDITTFPETATCNDVKSTGCAGSNASATSNLFVAKIVPSNAVGSQLVYLTFIGGSGNDQGGKVALDNTTNPPSLAVAGWTTSADFPVTNGSALKGPSDLVVFKLNGTGAFATGFGSMYFGGTGSEATQAAVGVATDSSGNVYVTSDTTSTDLPLATSLLLPAGNGFHDTYGGGVSDGFLAVFGATTGSLTYSTYFGINATVGGTAVAVDASGNAYVTGFTSAGTGFPATNAFQPCFGTSSTASPCPASAATDNAFIMQINTNPGALPPTTPIYASFLGGSGSDKGFAIALDTQSPPSAYLTGSTSSVDFPSNATRLPFQPCFGSSSTAPCPASAAARNAFFAVVSQAASVPSLAYATYLGGTGADYGSGVVVVSTSDVLVTGTTTSNNFPVLCPSQNFTGTQDAFTAAFNPTASGFASLLDSTFLGGSASTESNAIATDSSGDAVIFGDTLSHDFPLAANAGTKRGFQPNCASCQHATAEPDAFLTKSSISTAPFACVAFNPTSANFGSSTPVGTAASPVPVQLTDDGNLALTITAMNIVPGSGTGASDFTLNPNSCPVNPATPPSLAAGANCSFQLNFTPSVTAPETATLQITGTDTNSNSIQQNLDLTGAGIAPEVTLTTPTATCPSTCPASLTFGSITVNATSAVQNVTLTNTGNSPLTVSSVALDSTNGNDATDFILNPSGTTTPCGSNNPIAPNGTCNIAVQFAPKSGSSSGTPFIGQVDIADNANNNSASMQTIALSGTGIAQTFIVGFTPANPSFAFPNQNVGTTSSTMSVTLTNSGTGTLNISSITFVNAPTPNPFNFDPSTTCPVAGGTIGPNNGTCIIAVDFAPTTVGSATASVSISDNSSNVSSPQLIPVSGTGAGAIASITPAGNPPTLTFGSIQVGTTSTVQTATLTNTGNLNLVISANGLTIVGANPVDFQFSAQTTCTAGGPGLAPNGSCNIAVDFAPQASGPLFASVSIADNAGGSPQTIALTGTGTQPVASLSQTAIPFGSVNVSTTSTGPVVTLTNSGNQTLSNITVSIDPSIGTPGDFAFAAGNNTCKTVGALQPNQACSITITFTPATQGLANGQVDITDNAANSPQTISLNGTGTAPGVSLSPTTLSFPNENIGVASPSQPVTLTNSGSGPLTINSIGFTSPNPSDFGQTNNCPLSPQQIAPGNSCTISVFFKPTATGQRSASLTIADSGPGSPQTVGLAGTGTEPVAVISPSSGVSFPASVVGTSSGSRALTVTNQGTGPLVISMISFNGANMGDFSETDNCTGPANAIAVQKSCTIAVNFVPTAAGPRSANLILADNTASGSEQVPVSGQATDFQLVTSGGATSATITAGETAIFPLQVNPEDGFTGTITFGCVNPPPKGFCTVSPTSLPISGSTPVSFSVNVGTTANGFLLPRWPFGGARPRIPVFLWLLVGLLGLLLWIRASGNRRRLVPRFVLAFAVLPLASCGGGGGGNPGGNNGTPPGTYTVTATGAVGAGAARQIKLNVTVQ